MAGKLKNRLLYLVTEWERANNKRVSQAELARELGISYNALIRWLNNDVERFDAPIIERLCEHFGVEVGDLLYIDRSGEEGDAV